MLLARFVIPLGTQHLVSSSHTIGYRPDLGLKADNAVLVHKPVLITE